VQQGKSELYGVLARHFNEGELRTLTFDLGLDYEDLPGVSRAAKARELVLFAERRGRLSDLAAYLYRLRPKAFSGEIHLEHFGTSRSAWSDTSGSPRIGEDVGPRSVSKGQHEYLVEARDANVRVSRTAETLSENVRVLRELLEKATAAGELLDEHGTRVAAEDLEDVTAELSRSHPRIRRILRRLEGILETLRMASGPVPEAMQADAFSAQAIQVASDLVALAQATSFGENV
jgi:hypothetical protein